MSVDHVHFYAEDDVPEEEVHSPTDSSEDSVEVKVSPISGRNKRKCAEPRRVQDPAFAGPLKKRMCLQARAESQQHQQQPFRPWSKDQSRKASEKSVPLDFSVPYSYQPSVCALPSSAPSPSPGFFRPPSPIKPPSREVSSPQPVSLVIKREAVEESKTNEPLRVPTHPLPNLPEAERDNIIRSSSESFPRLQQQSSGSGSSSSRKEQRNYKNMTRERRIEANARERTRVHTISAAFDTLRKAIPAYSHSQKLSKLSVLRIACSYIMTLSDMVQDNEPSVQEGVEAVSRTIQREGKLRKKKDDE